MPYRITSGGSASDMRIAIGNYTNQEVIYTASSDANSKAQQVHANNNNALRLRWLISQHLGISCDRVDQDNSQLNRLTSRADILCPKMYVVESPHCSHQLMRSVLIGGETLVRCKGHRRHGFYFSTVKS